MLMDLCVWQVKVVFQVTDSIFDKVSCVSDFGAENVFFRILQLLSYYGTKPHQTRRQHAVLC